MERPFTQERLLALYPRSTKVMFGELALTLGQALDMETLCPAPPEARADEIGRVARLAGALSAAGTLRQEDYNLLELISPKAGK